MEEDQQAKTKREYWPIAKLKGWDKNPRTITEDNFARLKAQIKELGEYKPLIITKSGVVLGGNMRLRAYRELGYERCWVSVVDAKTEEERLKYSLSDNDHLGEYERDELTSLINNLPETDLSDFTVNFGEGIPLTNILSQYKEIIEDDPPELVDGEPVSKYGEIYQLGSHKLMCGDSMSMADIKKLIGKEKVDMVVTSPPYWLGFAYEQEKTYKEIRKHIKTVATNLSQVTEGRIIINTANIASVTKAQAITGSKEVILLVDWWRDELKKNGYLLRNIRIWAKRGLTIPSSKGDSVDMHWEYIAEFLDAGFSANFYKEDAVWRGQTKIGSWANKWSISGIWIDIKGTARGSGHVASFPVEIPWRLIQLYSNEGDTVLEPYCGSGTTIIACEQVGRVCYGIDLSPQYVDVARKRYANFIEKGNVWEEVTKRIA